jgi:hypothetical protein
MELAGYKDDPLVLVQSFCQLCQPLPRQNVSFSPNWMMRSEFGRPKLSTTTDVILPTVDEEMLLPGG